MGWQVFGAQAQILFGQEMETLIAVLLTLAILYFSEIIPKPLGLLLKKLLVPSAYLISF